MEYYLALKKNEGNSLVVQWLGHHAFTAEGRGSIPVLGTKILQATWCSQKFLFFEKKNNNVKKKKGMKSSYMLQHGWIWKSLY